MSELLKQINSLAVFGGIRQREPLNSLCAFLRLSDTVGAAQTDVIEAYSEFIRTLYTMRSDADFSGALWDSLEETENVYLDLKKNGAEKLLRKVVKGMLPKNKLARQILDNLYIYEGPEHKHQAQSPKTIDINQYK